MPKKALGGTLSLGGLLVSLKRKIPQGPNMSCLRLSSEFPGGVSGDGEAQESPGLLRWKREEGEGMRLPEKGSLEILLAVQPAEDCGPTRGLLPSQPALLFPAFLLALPAPGFLSSGLLVLPLSRDL